MTDTWTLADGMALCRAIQELPSEQFNCHPALTGGLLYKDGPRKDCDIVIYQRGDTDGIRPPIDWDALWGALETLGLQLVRDCGYVKKCIYKGREIDIFDPSQDGDVDYGKKDDDDVQF